MSWRLRLGVVLSLRPRRSAPLGVENEASHGEVPMRRVSESSRVALAAALLLFTAVFVTTDSISLGAGVRQAVPENTTADIPILPYKLVEWPTPPTTAAGVPGAWNFIQVASVAVVQNGHVLVLHRGAHALLEFAADGRFVRSWGDGLFSE